MIRACFSWIGRHFPLLVVAIVYFWSMGSILAYRQAQVPAGTDVVLRIGHWQLEPGVREAFNRMADAYRVQHPRVTIVQDAIPEGTYGQWMTTQLMGGTAPDIIEVGMLNYNIILGYHSRYFVPLTTYVNQPNPYNAGTALEGMPWRKTYKDAMRGSYVEELQEYMTVTLAQFGCRIFYNRDLLKRLTGLDAPPHDYRGFLAVCEKIKSQRDARGRPYTPITSSNYHMGMWEGFMCDPPTYGAVRRIDFNRDGAVGNDELFVGFKTGRIGFDFPPYAAKYSIMRELTSEFQPGFTGLGRDEAVFPFIQQRAVFISTGTWDAGSLQEQAKGLFEIGVTDFPLPGRDDSEFGSVIEGPVYERPAAGFPFAITRTSKHPEVALDFLRFLGSQPGNQKLNDIIGWIPAISDTTMTPLLQAFAPHLEGVYGALPLTLGGETIIKWQQLTALFQVHQIDYKEMTDTFAPFYLSKGVEEFAEAQRNRRRGVAREEQFLAGFRARAMGETGTHATSLWIKYRQLTGSRLITRNLNAARLQKILEEGVTTNALAPYAFSDGVLMKVRARVAAGNREQP